MGDYLEIHPVNPDVRQIKAIASSLLNGAVVAYPTDSGYALGCTTGMRKPLERLRTIRSLPADHNFTLICRDLSEIATYAKVSNPVYRLLKKATPGGYTFILPASQEVPRLLQVKRKTIGIRVPDHQIALALANELGRAFVSTTLMMPGASEPLIYPDEVSDLVGSKVDMVIDGGYCGFEPTTVVDLTGNAPEIIRQGSGDISLFQ